MRNNNRFPIVHPVPLLVICALVIATVVFPTFNSQAVRAAANPDLMKDIFPGSMSSELGNLTVVGSTLFFTANDDVNEDNWELWKSDGTAAGTMLVKDINPGTAGSYPNDLTVIGSTLYFQALDGADGGDNSELWKSDGTAAGTVIVADINPGDGGSWPYSFTVVGSMLFFTADDGTNGDELWQFDTTSAVGGSNPKMVFDRNEAVGTPTVVGSTLLFRGTSGSAGYELIMYDTSRVASASNPGMVKDFNVGSGNSSFNFSSIGATAYIGVSGTSTSNNDGLWQFDTTSATGASNPEKILSFIPRSLNVVGSTLFFTANDGSNGTELWQFDTTNVVGASNPQMVSDIRTGISGSSPGSLTVVGSILFFTANDGSNGTELWQFDTTNVVGASNPQMVSDIRTGISSSSPGYLTAVGSTLFFTANDGSNGTELWKFDTALPVSTSSTSSTSSNTVTTSTTPTAGESATTTIPTTTTTSSIAKSAGIPRSQVPGTGRVVAITQSAPPRVAAAVGMKVSSNSISLALARPTVRQSLQPTSYSISVTRIGWGVVSRRSIPPASASKLASISFSKLTSARYEVIVLAKNANGKTIGRWKSPQFRVGKTTRQK